MTDETHKTLIALLELRVEKILTAAAKHPDEILSEHDGIDTVCIFCDVEKKLCLSIPGFLCANSRKAGTLLDENERIAAEIRHDHSIGICQLCGKPIGKRYLKTNPDSAICTQCTAAVKRKSPAGKRTETTARNM